MFWGPRTNIKQGLGHKPEAETQIQTNSFLLHLLVALSLTFPASLVHAVETKLTCLMICHQKKDKASLLVSVPHSLQR